MLLMAITVIPERRTPPAWRDELRRAASGEERVIQKKGTTHRRSLGRARRPGRYPHWRYRVCRPVCSNSWWRSAAALFPDCANTARGHAGHIKHHMAVARASHRRTVGPVAGRGSGGFRGLRETSCWRKRSCGFRSDAEARLQWLAAACWAGEICKARSDHLFGKLGLPVVKGADDIDWTTGHVRVAGLCIQPYEIIFQLYNL